MLNEPARRKQLAATYLLTRKQIENLVPGIDKNNFRYWANQAKVGKGKPRIENGRTYYYYPPEAVFKIRQAMAKKNKIAA
jgi:hypothetical protein